jgi:hypothetical protein
MYHIAVSMETNQRIMKLARHATNLLEQVLFTYAGHFIHNLHCVQLVSALQCGNQITRLF